jgi:hypothetical protein
MEAVSDNPTAEPSVVFSSPANLSTMRPRWYALGVLSLTDDRHLRFSNESGYETLDQPLDTLAKVWTPWWFARQGFAFKQAGGSVYYATFSKLQGRTGTQQLGSTGVSVLTNSQLGGGVRSFQQVANAAALASPWRECLAKELGHKV